MNSPIRRILSVVITATILILDSRAAVFAGDPKPSEQSCRENLILMSNGGLPARWTEQMVNETNAEPAARQLLRNAVQTSGFNSVAINPVVPTRTWRKYTHTVPLVEVRDQGDSGRCWLFAAEGMLRSILRLKSALPKDFKFSLAYLYFFTMLERSNKFLAQVVGLRKADTVSADEMTPNIGDGGLMENFLALVSKYGLVPEQAFPETAASMDTNLLIRHLNTVLASGASQMKTVMKQAKKKSRPEKTVLEELRQIQNETMQDIWRVLVSHLGTPPLQFDFRTEISETEEPGGARTAPVKITPFTPQQFAREIVGFDAKDWVEVASNPLHKTGKIYEFPNATPCVACAEEQPLRRRVINVDPKRFSELVVEELKQNRAVYVSLDADYKYDPETGILDPARFASLADVYGLRHDHRMSRREAIWFSVLEPNHAMTLVGYDQPDPAKPWTSLLALNSWGKDSGDDGFFHMTRAWFEKGVFRYYIHKSSLDPSERTLWESGKPVQLSK